MMKNQTILIASLLGLTACGSSSETTSSTTTSTTSSTQWWVTNDTASTTTSTSETTKSTTETDKPEAGWVIIIENSKEGFLSLSSDGDSGSCSAFAWISNVQDTKDCSECYYAMTMDIGEVEIDVDGGGCDDLKIEGWSNQNLAFGAGAPDYGDFYGKYYTSLWVPNDAGDWKVDSNYGYSATYEEDGDDYTLFGSK